MNKNSHLTQNPAWTALLGHARETRDRPVAARFARDPERASRLSVEVGSLFLDYSRQLVEPHTIALLADLAAACDLDGWTRRMLAGEAINASEGRAVLHMALRAAPGDGRYDAAVRAQVAECRARIAVLASQVREGKLAGAGGLPLQAVVNIGTGGSDLGARAVVRALRAQAVDRRAERGPEMRFASNMDPADMEQALHGLDPRATLFIVTSKSFTTVETLANAARARDWLRAAGCDEGGAFIAVTANVAAAVALGIAPERVLPMWDWVGGRFSVWSAAGLPVALACGMAAFDELLAGARAMDQHFLTAPAQRNLPVLLALLGIWNVNFLDMGNHVVLPYAEDLRELPSHLQQLEMESNGKRTGRDGTVLDYATAPVVWGAAGTGSQHSFHQLLHQGSVPVAADFIVPLADGMGARADTQLVANALAQAAALAQGDGSDASPGGRPSSTMLMDALTPRALGELLAAYEHKVFVQGVVWNVNSFDQPGVELGKRLAHRIAQGDTAGFDPATLALLARTARGGQA